MNETIYYQERDDFHPQSVFTDGPVSVQTGMLRVGNDTHSLAGVNSTRLQITLEQSHYNQKKIKPWCYGLYSYGVLAIIAAAYNHYFWLLWLLYAALAALYQYQLNKAITLDEIQRRRIATLVLKRNEGDTSVVIGEWTNHIDNQLESKMVRVGYSKNDASRYNELYAKEMNRAESIANAVGSAIVHTSPVSAA